MLAEQESFLQSLIAAPGPSNYEEAVQKIWRKYVAPLADELHVDVHGNQTATLRGTSAEASGASEISVLIVGHADEVGLIVKYISDAGFLYVSNVGGVDPAMLASQRVRILSSKKGAVIPGVVGRTSVHLKEKGDDAAKTKYSDVWIDIGAKDKAEAELLVAIGDVIIYGEDYQRLAGSRAAARCFDNRIGLFVVAETLRLLAERKKELRATVYGVSSIQEETGIWGAGHAAFRTKPTLAIAIDVMPCTDSPGISKELHGDTKVSGGVVIDRGVRTNRRLSAMLIETADRFGIEHQINIENGHTYSDADPISSSREGVPVGVLSAPTRYLHSSCEVLDLEDLDKCVALLTAFILSLKPGVKFAPSYE